MNANKNYNYVLIVCMLLLLSCASSVPTNRVWRPWIRTIDNMQDIEIGSGIKTMVSGETLPLLGDEGLVAFKMKTSLDYLLERRGFVIDREKPDFVMTITYRTERLDKQQTLFSSSFASRADVLSLAGSGSGSTSGLGVAIARAVGLASMMSLQQTVQASNSYVSYTHTISAELRSSDESLYGLCQ